MAVDPPREWIAAQFEAMNKPQYVKVNDILKTNLMVDKSATWELFKEFIQSDDPLCVKSRKFNGLVRVDLTAPFEPTFLAPAISVFLCITHPGTPKYMSTSQEVLLDGMRRVDFGHATLRRNFMNNAHVLVQLFDAAAANTKVRTDFCCSALPRLARGMRLTRVSPPAFSAGRRGHERVACLGLGQDHGQPRAHLHPQLHRGRQL